MKKRVVILVLGEDKVGIVYNIAKVLFENNINIEDITQKVLDSKIFTMTMLVDMSKSEISISDLRKELESVSGQINVRIDLHHEDLFYSMHRI
ncbi:ACT domain-containing protein [Thermodesulfobium acidiphilum]|uniref:ACT domain-containing protein n=1 Tax=Thermodesulfobium acidiphilum TaxID=1794699 RepID=A0A2R4W178_THEAF|nr:ACT domain-containing protein [Thermodesulfobium acidiphilum]AWB10573.1 ACT domain-containing protein [Thermodesulfobium acidiphilum]PMP86279.1 MAG: ACT domain-containing protein [Thermodesulfobium narugense]